MNKKRQIQLFQLYCLDSSAIINLFRHSGLPYPPYPKDVFKGLWNKIENLISLGQIISHIIVLKEIEKRDDEIKKWCHKHKKMFKDIDDCQVEKINEIKLKYSKSHWDAETNRKGQEWADPWVIALATCKGAKIVSDEIKDKPDRIPYIANHFGITTLNLIEFLRDIKLVLK